MKLKSDGKMYILGLCAVAGICLGIVLERSNIVSLLFYLTFFILAFGLALQLYFKPILNELHVLAITITVLSFFHVALQADTLAFGYYKKLIMFACTALIVPFLDEISITDRQISWILSINLCIAGIYPLIFFTQGNPGYLGTYLTLHFSNPNAAAMFLLHSALYCGISLYYFKRTEIRLVILLLMISLVYLIYLTEARSCLIALVFFAALICFDVVLKKNMRFSPGFILFMLLLPLIVALMYMPLLDAGLLDEWFGFMVDKGKSLESREREWGVALEAIQRHPLFGDYYGISGGTGMSQKHNTHLDILASYGIVPFILFITLLYKGILRILPDVNTSFSRMTLFAFFAVIIQGTFEASLVSGGAGLYILSFGFLLLAKHDMNRKREKGIEK